MAGKGMTRSHFLKGLMLEGTGGEKVWMRGDQLVTGLLE